MISKGVIDLATVREQHVNVGEVQLVDMQGNNASVVHKQQHDRGEGRITTGVAIDK